MIIWKCRTHWSMEGERCRYFKWHPIFIQINPSILIKWRNKHLWVDLYDDNTLLCINYIHRPWQRAFRRKIRYFRISRKWMEVFVPMLSCVEFCWSLVFVFWYAFYSSQNWRIFFDSFIKFNIRSFLCPNNSFSSVRFLFINPLYKVKIDTRIIVSKIQSSNKVIYFWPSRFYLMLYVYRFECKSILKT